MSSEQPGLHRRMAREARRISSQHRQLDVFHDVLAGAIERGDAEAAGAGFQRFDDALDAHFSLEDRLYFPALRGLRPELDGTLAQLVREHVSLRAELDDLRGLVAGKALDAAARQLHRFADLLADHEEREERIVAGIAGETDPA